MAGLPRQGPADILKACASGVAATVAGVAVGIAQDWSDDRFRFTRGLADAFREASAAMDCAARRIERFNRWQACISCAAVRFWMRVLGAAYRGAGPAPVRASGPG